MEPHLQFDELGRGFMERHFTYEILDENKAQEILNTNNIITFENTNTNSNLNTNEIDVKKLKDEDIISNSVMFIYSLPAFGKMSCLVLLNIHALLYYESIGASLLYLSFFVALARACEIILKPVVAHISDETRSKYGRRIPYMLLGCGFYAIFLVLLFTPPSMKTGATNISIWFGVFYVLFFISDTFTNVPYLALGPELSTNSKERERLYIFFYMFQYFGVLFASAAPVILNRFAAECDCTLCINNPLNLDIEACLRKCKILCGVKHNRHSLFYMSISIGLLYIFSIILLAVGVKEKNKNLNKLESMKFIPSLYQLVQNKPFRKLLVPWIIDVLISTIFATMIPFFLNFVINPQRYCLRNKIDLNESECSVNFWLGISISTFFICCILYLFPWHYLVKKFGKKRCWQAYSLLSVLTFSLFLMCDEGSVGILLVASVLCAVPAGGAYLNDVFLSDVIDYDEFFTGKRNEGIYTVFAAFIPKVVSIFAQSIPLSVMACNRL
jgi:Na+/melibiose symporter-like transporter